MSSLFVARKKKEEEKYVEHALRQVDYYNDLFFAIRNFMAQQYKFKTIVQYSHCLFIILSNIEGETKKFLA